MMMAQGPFHYESMHGHSEPSESHVQCSLEGPHFDTKTVANIDTESDCISCRSALSVYFKTEPFSIIEPSVENGHLLLADFFTIRDLDYSRTLRGPPLV
jgi:hypothetical protein